MERSARRYRSSSSRVWAKDLNSSWMEVASETEESWAVGLMGVWGVDQLIHLTCMHACNTIKINGSSYPRRAQRRCAWPGWRRTRARRRGTPRRGAGCRRAPWPIYCCRVLKCGLVGVFCMYVCGVWSFWWWFVVRGHVLYGGIWWSWIRGIFVGV